MKTETVTQEDGWQYQRVIDVDKMSALELLALYKDRDANAELVLVYDDESESAEPTFQDMVQHIQDGGIIGLYPMITTTKPILYDYFVTIVERRTYRIQAESEQAAIDKSEDHARGANPVSYNYDPKEVELCK